MGLRPKRPAFQVATEELCLRALSRSEVEWNKYQHHRRSPWWRQFDNRGRKVLVILFVVGILYACIFVPKEILETNQNLPREALFGVIGWATTIFALAAGAMSDRACRLVSLPLVPLPCRDDATARPKSKQLVWWLVALFVLPSGLYFALAYDPQFRLPFWGTMICWLLHSVYAAALIAVMMGHFPQGTFARHFAGYSAMALLSVLTLALFRMRREGFLQDLAARSLTALPGGWLNAAYYDGVVLNDSRALWWLLLVAGIIVAGVLTAYNALRSRYVYGEFHPRVQFGKHCYVELAEGFNLPPRPLQASADAWRTHSQKRRAKSRQSPHRLDEFVLSGTWLQSPAPPPLWLPFAWLWPASSRQQELLDSFSDVVRVFLASIGWLAGLGLGLVLQVEILNWWGIFGVYTGRFEFVVLLLLIIPTLIPFSLLRSHSKYNVSPYYPVTLAELLRTEFRASLAKLPVQVLAWGLLGYYVWRRCSADENVLLYGGLTVLPLLLLLPLWNVTSRTRLISQRFGRFESFSFIIVATAQLLVLFGLALVNLAFSGTLQSFLRGFVLIYLVGCLQVVIPGGLSLLGYRRGWYDLTPRPSDSP